MNGPRFIDTNILLYSISRDPTEASKREIAIALLDAENIALAIQVLQEFYVQATRASRPDALAHDIAVGSPHGFRGIARRSASFHTGSEQRDIFEKQLRASRLTAEYKKTTNRDLNKRVAVSN